MNHRYRLMSAAVLAVMLVATTPLALAATAGHPPLTPAQRMMRIQSRIGHLQHRETRLRARGKTRRLAKVEARVAKLQARLGMLRGG